MVSDGFGVVHRKQASVYELAEELPSAAGLLIEQELDVLERLTTRPEKPYTVVLGGSKVSDKLDVIGALLPQVDALLVGGGMLFTFLVAQGHKVGASLLEEDQVDTVRGYLEQAKELGVEIVLPTDIVVASEFGADAEIEITAADAIEDTAVRRQGARARHRARDRGGVRQAHPCVEDRVLERPDGRVRARAVRGRHPCGRRSPGRLRRVRRGRRR